PAAEDGARAEDRGDRQAAAERLAAAEEIGPDALALDREHPAGASEAGEDLVGDQQGTGAPAELGEPGEPARRRQEDSFAADDRLDEDARDVVAFEARDDRGQIAAEGKPSDVRMEVRGEGVAKRGTRRGGEGAERQTVIAGIERDDARPAGRGEGGLERDLDSFGAGDREEDLGVVDRRESREALGEREASGMGRDVAEGVNQEVRLRRDSSQDLRMAMADRRHAETGGQIDEPVAVGVEDVRSAGLLPDEGGPAGGDGRDPGCDEALEPGRERARARAGRRDDDPRRQIAALEAGHGYIARRPDRERPSVTSSVYSMSPPIGIPNARRVTRRARDLSRR